MEPDIPTRVTVLENNQANLRETVERIENSLLKGFSDLKEGVTEALARIDRDGTYGTRTRPADLEQKFTAHEAEANANAEARDRAWNRIGPLWVVIGSILLAALGYFVRGNR